METVGVTLELLKTVQKLIDLVVREYQCKSEIPTEAKLFISFANEMQSTVKLLKSKNVDTFTPGREFLKRMDIRLANAYEKLWKNSAQTSKSFSTRFVSFFFQDAFINELKQLRQEMTAELELLKTQYETIWHLDPSTSYPQQTYIEEVEQDAPVAVEKRSSALKSGNFVAKILIADAMGNVTKVGNALRKMSDGNSTSSYIRLKHMRTIPDATSRNSSAGELQGPRGVCGMPNDSFLVCDSLNNKLKTFGLTGQVVAEKWFDDKPLSVAVTKFGIVVGLRSSVVVLDFDYQVVDQWSSGVRAVYQLEISDCGNYIYTCNSGNCEVNVLGRSLQLVKTLPVKPATPRRPYLSGMCLVAPDDLWLSDRANECLLVINSDTGTVMNSCLRPGLYAGSSFKPQQLVFHRTTGGVFCADELNNRILLFDSEKKSLLSVVTDESRLHRPCGLALWNGYRLMVASMGSNTVVLWEIENLKNKNAFKQNTK